MAPLGTEGYSASTFDRDEYCVLMTVYEVVAEYRDLLIRIHGRSPPMLEEAFSRMREGIAERYGGHPSR
jgi:hypothetical protein